jgi:cytidine deaminase
MKQEELVKIAIEAKDKAYAPYSNFRVGAALLTEGGKVFTGVNVENASYGATCCAERTAVFKAISEGHREIKAVAIASDSEHFTYPCGICRQVLAEFGKNDMLVLCSNPKGEFKSYRLEELLPEAFREVR